MIERLTVRTPGKGLHEVTAELQAIVTASGLSGGLCTVMVQHTSASLTIQENADPSARHDLEAWLDRAVPENEPYFLHTAEGPDDMPAHIKASMMGSSVSIPITKGHLNLGTWQGIYLCEHRDRGGQRRLVVTATGS